MELGDLKYGQKPMIDVKAPIPETPLWKEDGRDQTFEHLGPIQASCDRADRISGKLVSSVPICRDYSAPAQPIHQGGPIVMKLEYYRAAITKLEAEINQLRILTIEEWPHTPGSLRHACLPMAQAAIAVRDLLQQHGLQTPTPAAVPVPRPDIRPELLPCCNVQNCQTLLAMGQRHLTLVNTLQSIRDSKPPLRLAA